MPLAEDYINQGRFLFKYRGQLPVIILVAGFAVYLKSQSDSQLVFSGINLISYERGCLIITLTGLLLRFFIVGYAFPNTSGRDTKELKADFLNTTGFYSVLRHPLYTSNH